MAYWDFLQEGGRGKQVELAEVLGVTQSYVSLLAKNGGPVPVHELRQRIQAATGGKVRAVQWLTQEEKAERDAALERAHSYAQRS